MEMFNHDGRAPAGQCVADHGGHALSTAMPADRKVSPRVPITAKLWQPPVAEGRTNSDMDLHAQQIQGFFDIPVSHLYAGPGHVRY